MREAIVAALKADEDLSAYMAANNGHWYDYSTGAKWPLRLSKSDCPAVIVMPAGLASRAATNVEDDFEVSIEVGCACDSRDVGEAEDLWWLIEAALRKSAPSFGLTGYGSPHLARLAGLTVEQLAGKGADDDIAGVNWGCRDRIVLTCRRQFSG